MTRYIPKDKLKEIRSLSAIDYLKNYHPDLLIRNGRTDTSMSTMIHCTFPTENGTGGQKGKVALPPLTIW